MLMSVCACVFALSGEGPVTSHTVFGGFLVCAGPGRGRHSPPPPSHILGHIQAIYFLGGVEEAVPGLQL